MRFDWIYGLLGKRNFLWELNFAGTICPKCGHRLKYAREHGPDIVQCVMCERLWRQLRGNRLGAVEGNNTQQHER
ncbi:MAG TPA: hypothetical protein VKB46_15795 [Pyrinomonadaceae bacterium]|nr:hypothetical protein [Pyrinomonadaceae bacterium]